MNALEREKRIIQAAHKGDHVGLNKLLLENANRLLSVSVGILGNRAEAEEAVQDAMLQAFRNIRKFRFESAFSTWLHRITVNTCLTRKRKSESERVRNQSLEREGDSPMSAFNGSPHKALEKVQRRSLIERSIRALPENHRLVLILYHLNELTYTEIAQLMDLPLNTVKTNIRRGREQLARILARSEGIA